VLVVSIWHVDAFAEQPFTGNAAAVCLLDEARDDAWMQSVAAELNLSETAFVVPRGTSGHDLRWFTPTVEVDLCGHATLAAAHVLWEAGRLAQDATARFHTRSGLLTAAREGRCIELDFPALPPEPAQASPDLLRALGAAPERSLRSRQDALLVLSSEEAVRALRPDFAALRRVEARSVIVTALARAGSDFVSRTFAPKLGIDEDPVTGASHCALAPYWCGELGRESLLGYQCSARGGFVRVRSLGARVRLGGRAVTVIRGALEA